ncbi:MAG TPA: SprB repeat-containing protein, partial [Flavobacteriales bacterium]|nr:SprB repeat-containing protein [Flavobacteriales bacterium]
MNRPLRTLLLLAICHTTPLFALTVNISVNVFPTCNYPSGQLHANASGGVGPYSYLWSNGATTEY